MTASAIKPLMNPAPLILLAAGGTGGHLFPAEALGVELIRRGYRVRLATDARALRYSGLFTRDMIDVVPSETVRGRNPISLARTAIMLGYGTLVAFNLVRRLKPAAVVGFGGYPTVPPLMAARLSGVPAHHPRRQCRARPRQPLPLRPRRCDRDLAAGRARPRSGAGGKDHHCRHADAAGDSRGGRRRPTIRPQPNGPLRLLVVGGSQGARVMSDIVPPAIEQLEPALWRRIVLTQQVREEDMARVRAVYDRLKINAELAPFFSDLPARLASTHLVISRSGAGTVAELAAIGRPSILVPLPGAIDQDQFANAGVLAQVDGAIRIVQSRVHAGPAGVRNLRLRRRARAAHRHGRRRPQRRPPRRRRAAGRSGGQSRRNLTRHSGAHECDSISAFRRSMAGLVPAIHVLHEVSARVGNARGRSPGMTRNTGRT